MASVVLAATCVAAQESAPPDDAQDAASSIKGADLDLVRSVRVVGDRVARIVQIDRTSTVIAVRADEPTRATASAQRAQRLLPNGRADARGRAWSDLGLGAGTEPRDLAAALARDLPGMTFDAVAARLLVDPQRLLPDSGHADPDVDATASVLLATGVTPDEAVAGHYMAHALLDGASLDGPVTTDALLAHSALAEGTANLAALVFLFGGLGLESEVVSGVLKPEDALEGRLVPEDMRSGSPVLRSLLEYVYLDGFAQCSALARKGGFGRLAQERRVRRSTRDVLHVDRAPAPVVDIPAPGLPPGLGLTVADQDSLGEQGIVTLVSLLTGKDNLGLIAGDGWAGDALWRFEGGDSGATIWVTRWLTEEDAKDFVYAIERCLLARFPTERPEDDDVRGGRVLRRPDRTYRIQKTGLEVVVAVLPPALDAKMNPIDKKKGPKPPAKSSKSLN